MALRVHINRVLCVAAAADDSDVRLHVDGGEGIVVGEDIFCFYTFFLLCYYRAVVLLDSGQFIVCFAFVFAFLRISPISWARIVPCIQLERSIWGRRRRAEAPSPARPGLRRHGQSSPLFTSPPASTSRSSIVSRTTPLAASSVRQFVATAAVAMSVQDKN